MHRSLPVALATAVILVTLAAPIQASGLRQTHPARLAPSTINSAGDFNEYPWFTYDGKLMFWTREDPPGSAQKLWAVYIKNRGQIITTPEGNNINLPGLLKTA